MPTLTATPNPAAPSTVVAIAGTGFAYQRTRLLLDGAGATTNVFRPKKDGSFNVGITVASSPRTQVLAAQQLQSSVWVEKARLSIAVQAVVEPPPPPPPSPPTTGPTFYVATNGSDSNDGSQLRPWASIQKFINTNPAPGSTLLLRGGAYPRSAGGITAGDAYGSLIGTVAAPITIKNAPGETVTFPNVTEPTIIFHGHGQTGRVGASYVILEGINFPNILVDDAAAVVVGGDHVTKYLVNHITIRKASMNLAGTRRRVDHCIGLIDGAEDTTIEDMDLAGTPTSGFGIAIYSNTAPLRTTIRRLNGHDFGSMPIQVWDYAYANAVASISVEDSTFRRNGECDIDLRWHGTASVKGCNTNLPEGKSIYDPNMPAKTARSGNTFGVTP